MTNDPYKGVVADLVDPYLTQQAKNSFGGFRIEGGESATRWLRSHPGRWALVGEGTTGLSRDLLNGMGLNGAVRTSKIDGITRHYGQCPHPQAESLSEALERRPAVGIYLPEVTKSEFGWTPAELVEACRTARENLFPTGAP